MQSSKPAAFSNYSVQISPAYLISGGSKALVRFASNSGGGEFIPVILSPVRKEMSNEQQPTKMKRKLGLEAAEIKVKSRNAEISVKPREPEACSQELPPKGISKEEDPVAVKISCRRSWVRVVRAFQFSKLAEMDPRFHKTLRNKMKWQTRSRDQVSNHLKPCPPPLQWILRATTCSTLLFFTRK